MRSERVPAGRSIAKADYRVVPSIIQLGQPDGNRDLSQGQSIGGNPARQRAPVASPIFGARIISFFSSISVEAANLVAAFAGTPYTSNMPEAVLHPSPTLDVPRLDTGTSFRKEAYAALKRAITAMDIYDHPQEIRLDERRLSDGLGVSRTPIREAMTVLEQEGFVRTRPRRGIFVVRKTKREIVEMITVMAALESMAARLAAER